MANENRLDLVDRAKVYELACAGCTRHGELPGECYHDEPCERLIFAFTVAEPVDAVEVVHAEWLDGCAIQNGKEVYKSIDCSHCEEVFKIESEDREYWKKRFKLCPFCGAIMDGGNEDG